MGMFMWTSAVIVCVALLYLFTSHSNWLTRNTLQKYRISSGAELKNIRLTTAQQLPLLSEWSNGGQIRNGITNISNTTLPEGVGDKTVIRYRHNGSEGVRKNGASVTAIIRLETTRRADVNLTSLSSEHTGPHIKNFFRQALTARNKKILLDIIHVFDKAATQPNLSYFIYGGTLLGAYRHRGFIPWDDDADVMVSKSTKQMLIKHFRNLEPHYFLNTDQMFRWKLYSSLSHPIRGYTWEWPFLDINFFAGNLTHIWDVDPVYSEAFLFERNHVFPIRRRRFEDLALPVPRDYRTFLERTYKLDLCSSRRYDHRVERTIPHFEVPCEKLKHLYGFVVNTM